MALAGTIVAAPRLAKLLMATLLFVMFVTLVTLRTDVTFTLR